MRPGVSCDTYTARGGYGFRSVHNSEQQLADKTRSVQPQEALVDVEEGIYAGAGVDGVPQVPYGGGLPPGLIAGAAEGPPVPPAPFAGLGNHLEVMELWSLALQLPSSALTAQLG